MYIIELYFKLKEKWKNKKPKPAPKKDEDPLEEEKCEHIFAPLDSTNTIAACVKCGYIIHYKKEDFEKKNIFENNLNDDNLNPD